MIREESRLAVLFPGQGSADQASFANAIRMAMLEMGIPDRIGQRVSEVFASRESA